jgi:hypothetical protein
LSCFTSRIGCNFPDSSSTRQKKQSGTVMRAMKYLSIDLLPKVFHGLICVIYLSYIYNTYIQPKQTVFISPGITA